MKRQANEIRVVDFETGNKRKMTALEAKTLRIERNRAWKANIARDVVDDDPNPRHTEYYRHQLSLNNEELKQMLSFMSKSLSVSFRLGHISVQLPPLAKAMKRRIVQVFKTSGRYLEANGSVIVKENIIRSISWMDDDAWTLSMDGAELSRNDTLKHLHDFLTNETKLGHLTRQEVVSMIPVKLIGIKPYHVIVDLCAAPEAKLSKLFAI